MNVSSGRRRTRRLRSQYKPTTSRGGTGLGRVRSICPLIDMSSPTPTRIKVRVVQTAAFSNRAGMTAWTVPSMAGAGNRVQRSSHRPDSRSTRAFNVSARPGTGAEADAAITSASERVAPLHGACGFRVMDFSAELQPERNAPRHAPRKRLQTTGTGFHPRADICLGKRPAAVRRWHVPDDRGLAGTPSHKSRRRLRSSGRPRRPPRHIAGRCGRLGGIRMLAGSPLQSHQDPGRPDTRPLLQTLLRLKSQRQRQTF